MRARPISPASLVELLADRLAAAGPGRRLRAAVDGVAAADPERWGAALVDPLRSRGRPAVHVPAGGFLRPASLRYEFGRTNPDSFYTGWLDTAALRREVLDPAGPGGSGRILPSLWDPRADRATRAAYQALAPTAVILVSGPLLLGAGLPFDLTVHLALSPAARGRVTPDTMQWTLPAYDRYDSEVGPAAVADVVVRLDDPQHPALVDPG